MATAVNLTVRAENIDAILEVYDSIQVWRSTNGINGVYEEITSSSRLPARIEGSAAGPWNLAGYPLSVRLNGADPVTVQFTGSGPLDLQTAIYQITSQVPALQALPLGNTGKLALETLMVGTGATLEILPSTAAATLGLSTTKVNGKASRILLTSPTIVYPFVDLDGADTYYYKTRFGNTKTGSVDVFSSPIRGAPSTVVPSGGLSTAIAQFMTASGAPLVGRRLVFVLVSTKRAFGYTALPGSQEVVARSDESGLVQQPLLVGATYRVFFEGTLLYREFVVPEPGPGEDSFDLMDVVGTSPDPFSIAVPPPMPIRSS